MSGYQLLDLHDYLGQGTALVGILDTFWEPKGYATAEQFRRFNGETVPLARLTRSVLTANERLTVPVEIAHYGAAPLAQAQPWWRIEDSRGKTVLEGRFDSLTIPIGKNIPLGRIDSGARRRCRRRASTAGRRPGRHEGGERLELLALPRRRAPSAPEGVLVTHSWNAAEARLAEGGKVLYLPRKADLDWTSPPLATCRCSGTA
jgi:beta-galactosidase